MPNHTIVNNDAVGGNQAANEKIPVDAASTSNVSFDCSSTSLTSFIYFLFNGTVVTALSTTIHPAITEPMTA